MNPSRHYLATLVVAIVIVSAFTAPSGAQKYSDWSEPINLGPIVNSTATDRGPAISKDGLSLYFASTRLSGSFGGEDIYVSQRESQDSEWGPPVNLGPIINTTANEMVPAFSRDGHLLFFASNRLGSAGVDVWVSRREHTHDDFAWQPAENLGAGVNSASNDAGPNYFENDEVGVPQLYFNSNRPGGPGISNIYVSEQAADGSFGAAVLVVELSSLGETARSSIRHDGREIFFTSSRPGSINPQDLWVATRETVFDAWSAPINLGSTLNSGPQNVQPYISSDGETLFFASNRPGGLGSTDLYMSTRTKHPQK
jgi:hypothetical protein